MAIIELSAGWVSAMMPRLMNLNDNFSPGVPPGNTSAGSGLLQLSQNSAYSMGQILLMKGTVPTSASLFTVSSRSADILVRFLVGSNVTAGVFGTSQVSANPVIISTSYVAASASGTATWFMWINNTTGAFSAQLDSNAPLQQIIGTVGSTGSGADLEMVNTSLTAGETYRIMNFRLQFPTSWTY